WNGLSIKRLLCSWKEANYMLSYGYSIDGELLGEKFLSFYPKEELLNYFEIINLPTVILKIIITDYLSSNEISFKSEKCFLKNECTQRNSNVFMMIKIPTMREIIHLNCITHLHNFCQLFLQVI